MKIVLISAIWCGSCIIMKNKWNELEKEYNLNIIRYDYDMDEDEIKKYDVGLVLPVSIFLDENNNEVYRIIGEKNKDDLIKIIEQYK